MYFDFYGFEYCLCIWFYPDSRCLNSENLNSRYIWLVEDAYSHSAGGGGVGLPGPHPRPPTQDEVCSPHSPGWSGCHLEFSNFDVDVHQYSKYSEKACWECRLVVSNFKNLFCHYYKWVFKQGFSIWNFNTWWCMGIKILKSISSQVERLSEHKVKIHKCSVEAWIALFYKEKAL